MRTRDNGNNDVQPMMSQTGVATCLVTVKLQTEFPSESEHKSLATSAMEKTGN